MNHQVPLAENIYAKALTREGGIRIRWGAILHGIYSYISYRVVDTERLSREGGAAAVVCVFCCRSGCITFTALQYFTLDAHRISHMRKKHVHVNHISMSLVVREQVGTLKLSARHTLIPIYSRCSLPPHEVPCTTDGTTSESASSRVRLSRLFSTEASCASDRELKLGCESTLVSPLYHQKTSVKPHCS